MKKMKFLIVILLVLVSSSIFSGCGNEYKNLTITCSEQEISLVIDNNSSNNELDKAELYFELSGADSWGDVSITSNPVGLITVEQVVIRDERCYVQIKALQPSDDGASLKITHLGSGKSMEVPLYIGMRLNSIEGNGLNYIINIPEEGEEIVTISPKQVLNCSPTNYTDDILWVLNEGELPNGVQIVHNLYNGLTSTSTTDAFYTTDDNEVKAKYNGVSQASSSNIIVDSSCVNGEEIQLNPITSLNGEAILHKDIVVTVKFIKNVTEEDIVLTSPTHGYNEEDGIANELRQLVLVSNPNSVRNVVGVEAITGYNAYSSAIIDFKIDGGETYLSDLSNIYSIYDVSLSSNIPNLILEVLNIGQIRITATDTSVGEGEIVVKFSPKNSVGYIQEFSISIPCIVGEVASSITATNEGEAIEFTKQEDIYIGNTSITDDYTYSSGQRFRFNVLSINTLSALKSYKIKIRKELLYINPNYIQNNTSEYIRNEDGSLYDLTSVLGEQYQICLRKDGSEILFYSQGNYFVSEPLNDNNTIYIKYVLDEDNNQNVGDFSIDIYNFYDNSYLISNSEFEKTCITYRLNFLRQRRVESIEYSPFVINGSTKESPLTDSDWQFYFTNDMLTQSGVYYGFEIKEIRGINNTILTEVELSDISLQISIADAFGQGNLGVGIYNAEGITFNRNYEFVYNNNGNFSNCVVIGIIEGVANFGDYNIIISQNNTTISPKAVKIYKQLEEENIQISVQNADYNGEDYGYLGYSELVYKPDDWDTNWGNYYIYQDGEFKQVSAVNTSKPDFSTGFFKKEKVYILSSSSINATNYYDVNIQIDDENFVNEYVLDNENKLVTESGSEVQSDYLRYNFYYDKELNRITTGLEGSFDEVNNQKTYVQLTYIFDVEQYDYYQKSENISTIYKRIYLYIYQPITRVSFDKTQLYKYSYYNDVENPNEGIQFTEFADIYGKETLTIQLNNASVFNYVTDIQWKTDYDNAVGVVSGDKRSATFTFNAYTRSVSTIVATISQFGANYPIYCGVVVERPILTDRVVLNNSTNSFSSGDRYLTMNINDTIDITASQYSDDGDVSLKGLEYIICSTSGYASNGSVLVDENGTLTAVRAGRVCLIIVPKDRLIKPINNVSNYFNYREYLSVNVYVKIDILVSDGSRENPFFITNMEDLKNIKNGYHYALINDINLNGQAVNIAEFNGSFVSYQEGNLQDNRFSIYGIELNENNLNLFTTLLETAELRNINFYVNINCNMRSGGNIGLIGVNKGSIVNCVVNIAGNIDLGDRSGNYNIGGFAAVNEGEIICDNAELVGVSGQIIVQGGVNASVILGGIAGKNSGTISGAVTEIDYENSDVEYDVFYGNQGSTANIILQLKAVGTSEYDNSAIGGIVGENSGYIKNVYSTGSILGQDDDGSLTVNNVGGLIGINIGNNNIQLTVNTATNASGNTIVDKVTFNENNVYQITNSYSSATISGRDNVGGVVGWDRNGSFNKVYYEIYYDNTLAINGRYNIGGLIGKAEDSNLYYCYVNSFAWGYDKDSLNYEIVGQDFVGGLIGYAISNNDGGFNETVNQDGNSVGVHIVSSLSSLTMQSEGSVGGLIGYLDGYGAIYTAYFYGKIQANKVGDLVNLYINGVESNISSYNNAYSIINNEIKVNDVFDIQSMVVYAEAEGFAINIEYNNGMPYIVYNGTNLVSLIPTSVQISNAFYTYIEDDNGDYVLENGEYVEYDINNADHATLQRYSKIDYVLTTMYKVNPIGEYVLYNGKYEGYDETNENHLGLTRYSLMATMVDTNDTNSSLSDYREKVVVAYYYQFNSMAGEYASSDMQALNTINMHDLLNDDGIVTLPNTSKRFIVSTNNNSVVSVLNGGNLLLRSEGQAIVTITSILNPSASASFVLIVRKKMLNFNLYSSANMIDEYSIEGDSISIVKNTSKLIYADYSYSIDVYNREYECSPTTQVEIDFEISVKSGTIPTDKQVADYISINGVYNSNKYTVSYGTPITISVKEYFDGEFSINAKLYTLIEYTDDEGNVETMRVYLGNYFDRNFTVVTKKGVTAINTDNTYIDMMPNDEVNLQTEVKTDIKIDTVDVEILAYDNQGNYENAEGIAYDEMLDIYLGGNKISIEDGKAEIDISNIEWNELTQNQKFNLTLLLNEKAHYLTDEFILQIKLTAENTSSVLRIFVKPQEISSIMALNYRLENDGEEDFDITEDAVLSNIIRPGTRNIIVIDIAPSIAVFDYLEIDDISTNELITFIQLDENLNAMSAMDEVSSAGTGIKLKKENIYTSKLYVSAILPYDATANINHTIKITAYNKHNEELKTIYINVEAVLYPSIVATYTYPNGNSVIVDSRLNRNNTNYGEVDLALGVEAGINIQTFNIDEDSLIYELTIKGNNGVDITNNNLVSLNLEQNGYVLRFNSRNIEALQSLIGGTVSVTFTASKQLNGVVEDCSASLIFNIKRFVIHGVSVQHVDINGNIYGDYGQKVETQFYFGNNDISYYYNNSYWNSSYTIENTENTGNEDLQRINEILKILNSPWNNTDKVEIKINNEIVYKDIIGLDYYIKNSNNTFYIYALENSNINNLDLTVTFKMNFDANNRPRIQSLTEDGTTITKQVGFNIMPEANPFEDYEQISTPEEFNNMLEGRYYELTQDITLSNYTPLNTAIAGFNGAGHTITIQSFNMNAINMQYSNGIAYIGLFGELDENTVIQNLEVEYEQVELDFSQEILTNGESYTQIYFGGIAGQSLGVITNVLVKGTLTLTARQVLPEEIYVGGITSFNGVDSNSLATITNSSVELNISSLANIGGISNTNYGKIANTIFEGSVRCWSSSDVTSPIYTSGFVIYNRGEISLSSVNKSAQTELGQEGLRSMGTSAGFVIENSGSVADCYVGRIDIFSQGNIGGFVYTNSGSIINSYAYPSIESLRFYEKFIYETTNTGVLKNCYVIDSSSQTNVEGLSVIEPNQIANKLNFNGFIFASTEYGVWSITDDGPILKNSGYSEYDENNIIFNIYDAETFEGYFELSQRVEITGEIYVYNNFRIVRDIDLSTLTNYPITSSITFMGTLEGNNMTISGYNIYNGQQVDKIGLFASIKQNTDLSVYVRNIIINPNSVRASGSKMVGGLAGEIDGAYMYNITVDNNDLLVLGRNAVGGVAGIIKGAFEIIGINSNASAFSAYTYNVGQQYNLYVGGNVNKGFADNIEYVSYSGSIAGIVDGYNFANPSMSVRQLSNYFTIKDIELTGSLVLIGETVGGAFGLVGERTLVENISYNIDSATLYQGKYFSGGLVGENRGAIINAKISLVNEDNDEDINTLNCFNNFANINGGIVGVNIGGLVYNSFSNIDIYTTRDLASCGGIVGRNIEGTVSNCEFDGRVDGYISGGIIATDYKYETINSLQNTEAVATESSKVVYNNIKDGVIYIMDSVEIGRISNNIITKNFLIKFVPTQSMYYNFNTSQNENDSPVIATNKLHGLIIGLSDREFSITTSDILINGQGSLIVTVEEKVDDNENSSTIKLKYNGTEYTLKPIRSFDYEYFDELNVSMPNDSDDFILLYLIGCENGSFDYWASALNYSKHFIVLGSDLNLESDLEIN